MPCSVEGVCRRQSQIFLGLFFVFLFCFGGGGRLGFRVLGLGLGFRVGVSLFFHCGLRSFDCCIVWFLAVFWHFGSSASRLTMLFFEFVPYTFRVV